MNVRSPSHRHPGVRHILWLPWVGETLKQLDETMHIKWQVADGDTVLPNQELFQLRGKARSLLSESAPC